MFRLITGVYTRRRRRLAAGPAAVLLMYAGLLGSDLCRFVDTPKGFIPSQDMGYLMVNVQLPDSASMERTQDVISDMVKIAQTESGR